jgi:hypothetical protein
MDEVTDDASPTQGGRIKSRCQSHRDIEPVGIGGRSSKPVDYHSREHGDEKAGKLNVNGKRLSLRKALERSAKSAQVNVGALDFGPCAV